jgi:hypothetical protein
MQIFSCDITSSSPAAATAPAVVTSLVFYALLYLHTFSYVTKQTGSSQLTCIQDTDHPYCGFLLFPLALPDERRDKILKLGYHCSFPQPFQFSFHYHLIT